MNPNVKNKIYRMWYQSPAPKWYDLLDNPYRGKDLANDGWAKWSLPIGNGFMGVCTFGRTTTERLQVTESSLFNPMLFGGVCQPSGGLGNFAEIYIDFGHKKTSNYHRDLILNDGISSVDYDFQGVSYHRECFVSYPDKVFVMKLTASQKGALSFTIRPQIAFLRKGSLKHDDGCGKEGHVSASGNRILLDGKLLYSDMKFEGIVDVINNGGSLETDAADGKITVTNSDSAVILMTAGTNYMLCSKAFCESDYTKKLEGNPHPHNRLAGIMQRAASYSYEQLLQRHLDDFHEYFDRVIFDIGGEESDLPTDQLMTNYHYRDHNRYLEELAFHFGRYLLISSGRPGSLPIALSGVWNRTAGSNCGGGYFHDINLQMNYWAAFPLNLSEMFEGYVDFNKAYMPEAKRIADQYIAKWFPEKFTEKGRNGWIFGNSVTPLNLEVYGEERPAYSCGPGGGGLTALLFWDYYEYTQDKKILQNITYPILSSMSLFFSKLLVPFEDKLLVKYSASPEQPAYNYMTDEGPSDKCNPAFDWNTSTNDEECGYIAYGLKYMGYITSGCSFDQQMVYEVYSATIRAAEILGIEDDIVKTAREQIDKLDPTPIGASGQIKEYREEEEYGEIGDPTHRHISHLNGLLPGTHCFDTEEKLHAAEVTLTLRGKDEDMDGGFLYGFAEAFRICLWAKVRNGEAAYRCLNTLLEKVNYPNLMTRHWEIDTQIGTSYGISDMLVQSRWGCIEILPALPSYWSTGKILGVIARGNFAIDLTWDECKPTEITIRANAGGLCRIRLPHNVCVKEYHGMLSAKYNDNILSFATEIGKEYRILF